MTFLVDISISFPDWVFSDHLRMIRIPDPRRGGFEIVARYAKADETWVGRTLIQQ